MTKLLITEITRMGPAFCVIGLQRENERIYSIRPVPSSANGWIHFPHQRGDILEFSLTPFPGAKPHIEDRVSTRAFQKSSALAEAEIVPFLRRAELARSLPELFGCKIHENKKGSGLYAMPSEAQRSICGCETQNLRLEICANELRGSLVLPSGEVLRDLPAVDRDWRNSAGLCWIRSFRFRKRIGSRSFDERFPVPARFENGFPALAGGSLLPPRSRLCGVHPRRQCRSP
jgi:hypothetical protein